MPAYTTASIADLLSARLVGRPDLPIARLDTLESAGPDTLTFIRSHSYAQKFPASRAAAALVAPGLEVPGFDPQSRALIIVANADLALIRLLEAFAPPRQAEPGVHPSAVIHPTASVATTASIGPLCSIGPRASIAEGCCLKSNVAVEADASVGAGTVLHPGVVVGERCAIGRACILYAGVVIGADGFGYRPAPDGRGVLKIPHLGNVEIGDAVEIGANTCIDRAKFGSTTVGDGSKIDNLVQIGHNCAVGRACLVAACTGIGGSTSIGDGTMIGGHCGIADNLRIGSRVTIAAKSGVMNHIPDGETWWGFPATRAKDMARALALLRNLPEHVRAIRKLAKQAGIPHTTRGGRHED